MLNDVHNAQKLLKSHHAVYISTFKKLYEMIIIVLYCMRKITVRNV